MADERWVSEEDLDEVRQRLRALQAQNSSFLRRRNWLGFLIGAVTLVVVSEVLVHLFPSLNDPLWSVRGAVFFLLLAILLVKIRSWFTATPKALEEAMSAVQELLKCAVPQDNLSDLARALHRCDRALGIGPNMWQDRHHAVWNACSDGVKLLANDPQLKLKLEAHLQLLWVIEGKFDYE